MSEDQVKEVMPEYAAEQALEYAKSANPAPIFTDDELASIDTWEALDAALKTREYVATFDISDFGTGYGVLDSKDRLVDVPFIILDWRFSLGDMGEFVSVQCLTRSNERWIMNDGSTGIRDQLKSITAKNGGKHAVIRVNKGLHKSTYQRRDDAGNLMVGPNGVALMASTYYLKYDPS